MVLNELKVARKKCLSTAALSNFHWIFIPAGVRAPVQGVFIGFDWKLVLTHECVYTQLFRYVYYI